MTYNLQYTVKHKISLNVNLVWIMDVIIYCICLAKVKKRQKVGIDDFSGKSVK